MREDTKSKSGTTFATNAATGSAIGMAVCLILFLVFSLVIAGGMLSSSIMDYISIGVFFAGALIGGAVAIKKQKGMSLLVGLAEGTILFIFTLIVGAFIPGQSLIGNTTIPLFIAAIVGGALAGLLFSGRNKKRI